MVLVSSSYCAIDIGGFGALERCCYDEDPPGVAVGIFIINVIDNL